MQELTTTEAATLLGISPGGVRWAIHKQLLVPHRQINHTNMLTLDEVERYRANHLGKKGRPKEKHNETI